MSVVVQDAWCQTMPVTPHYQAHSRDDYSVREAGDGGVRSQMGLRTTDAVSLSLSTSVQNVGATLWYKEKYPPLPWWGRGKKQGISAMQGNPQKN